MEEKKNPPVPPKPEEKKAPAAAEQQQKQKMKNKMVMYIAYTIGAIIVVLILMKFFGKPGNGIQTGANTELPDPDSERQKLNNKQDTYDLDPSGGSSYDNRGFEDIFATAFSKDKDEDIEVPDKAPYDPYAEFEASMSSTQQSLDDFSKYLDQQRQNALNDSVTPEPSDREKELEAEVEALKMRQKAKEQADAAVASIMEESHRLAGEITSQKESDHSRKVEERKNQEEIARTNVSPLAGSGEEGIVSSLTEHRCASFYGMGGAVVNKNTIAASVYGKQVIMSGQQVRLRLEEPMVVGTQVLLPGSILTGTGTVGVDRLYISITSIEYNQVLTPVSLEAYDMDGQRGIFVPGSLEQEALRELGRDLASSLASTSEQSVSSFVNNQSAADRLKTDLARGAIQGVSRFAERKLDQLRITLQADHKLLLFPSNH